MFSDASLCADIKAVEEQRTEEPRQPALDGLRGVAILVVLAYHSLSLIPANFAPSVLVFILNNGWMGVDLFFALSGFLITGILLRTKGRTGYFKAFWLRRALRILPIYFVTLSVGLVVGEWVAPLHAALPPSRDIPFYFVFLTNWTALHHAWNPSMLGHFWSLAIEEQFYLIWPFCVLFFSRRNLRRLTVIIAFIALAIRTIYIVSFGPAPILWLTRVDSLALGACAATLLSSEFGPRRARVALVVALVAFNTLLMGIVVCQSQLDPFIDTIGFTLLAVTFAASVFYAAATRSRTFPVRALEARWLRNWGKYSYGIYLFHLPLLNGFKYLVRARVSALWHSGFAMLASVAVLSAASYYLAKLSFEKFETPILRLKRYAQVGPLLQSPALAQPKARTAIAPEAG